MHEFYFLVEFWDNYNQRHAPIVYRLLRAVLISNNCFLLFQCTSQTILLSISPTIELYFHFAATTEELQ